MLALLLLACTNADKSPTDSAIPTEIPADCVVSGDRPAGWSEATHSDDTDPNYGLVFDRSAVLALTLTVSADDYAAMYAELEELIGVAFGEDDRGPGGGGPGGGGPGGGGPGGDPGELLSADPSYVPVTVSANGHTWCQVGMRFKGNSTLSQTWGMGVEKLPFRLDFDRYEEEAPAIEDQRFYGFNELSFGNNMGDGTYIRDVMASIILADRGVPAAQNRFAAVYLDAGDGPQYLGLYTLVEDPSDALADRVWGDDDGEMYEGDGACADLSCFDIDSFEAKMNDGDGAEVEALVEALAAQDLAALDAAIDIDAFLRWLAVNSAIENWDTYGAMTHNYYLYALPEDGGRLQWIPWDHNLSLMDGLMGSADPLRADVGEDWPLIRQTLDDAAWNATYRAYLAEALDGAYEPERFASTAESLRALIAPYVVGELAERAESTFIANEADWDAAYESLYEHVADRRAEVEAAIEP